MNRGAEYRYETNQAEGSCSILAAVPHNRLLFTETLQYMRKICMLCKETKVWLSAIAITPAFFKEDSSFWDKLMVGLLTLYVPSGQSQ